VVAGPYVLFIFIVLIAAGSAGGIPDEQLWRSLCRGTDAISADGSLKYLGTDLKEQAVEIIHGRCSYCEVCANLLGVD